MNHDEANNWIRDRWEEFMRPAAAAGGASIKTSAGRSTKP